LATLWYLTHQRKEKKPQAMLFTDARWGPHESGRKRKKRD